MSNITKWQNSRNESFLFVKVEKDGYKFSISNRGGDGVSSISYGHPKRANNKIGACHGLPINANYALILDVDNATEEQAALVVDVDYYYDGCVPIYMDYTIEKLPFVDSRGSLHSLVRSLNLDPSYNYVVLKIEQ